MPRTALLQEFRNHRIALLTTYLDGGMTPVHTPVSIALDGDRLLFRVGKNSGTAARMAEYPLVDLRTCTLRGEPTGSPVRGRVRPLRDGEAREAARLLARRNPMVQRWAMPLSYRMLRYEPVHYELRLVVDDPVESSEGWPD
ncbi:PPOX class F420-dependent oxidoreductase [Thermobifida halotolerans]|uniref:PPOX class F420-dependent oxidoreductase n=1 Tax=Thermobifida halotolerans TaxID=483545 RepID=A0A399G047_9ACTN|nr:PPOX class F420-dependent oxidoreductase [Thermobifida halotolerans]UOE19134.1 PPOX class F420-dependent oxidoreductase [Thermobifida halotolerans]